MVHSAIAFFAFSTVMHSLWLYYQTVSTYVFFKGAVFPVKALQCGKFSVLLIRIYNRILSEVLFIERPCVADRSCYKADNEHKEEKMKGYDDD